MSKRIITAIVGLPLLVFIFYKGGVFLTIGVSFLTFVGIMEYTIAVNKLLEPKISLVFMALLAAMMTLTIKLDYYFLMPILLIAFILIFCFEIFSGNLGIERGSAMLFGLIYVPIMFGYLFLFENIQNGVYYMWMIFIIAFGTDTAAYFIGRSIGKRKLALKISPKKTVAGAIGGTFICGILVVGYGIVLGHFFNFNLPWYFYLAIGILGSIAGQCGDLTASMIKRRAKIKDYGRILPGHGGVLDRFDSILFIIPIIYIFASMTAGLA